MALTKGLFHRVMVVFYVPSSWPAWGIALVAIFLTCLSAISWWLVSGSAALTLLVGYLLLLFYCADIGVLKSLPRRGLSFESWNSQFFPLALPRAVATAVLGLTGLWLGWPWALFLLLAIQIAGSAALIRGARIEPRQLGLSELVVRTDRLATGTQPIRLLHISDIHIERWSVREAQLLAIVEQTQPELILITGDYANLSYNLDPVTHGQVQHLLSQLAAPHGVYATLGSPPVDLPQVIPPLFDTLPVELLRDEWCKLDLGDGRGLTLLGLDCHHDIPTDSDTLARVLADAPNAFPSVLLYHSPELMPQAVAAEIDLYVCGHTHGGQVRLPLIGPILTISALGRRYVMGLYHEGRTHLYVSRGVGFEGLSAPRVRFLCPPEVAIITIAPS